MAMKKASVLFLSLVSLLSLGVVSCGNESAVSSVTSSSQDVLPTAITLESKIQNLLGGEEYQIKASFLPVDSSETDLSYKSSNEEAATVSKTGLVTANNVDGYSTITVSSLYDPSIKTTMKVATTKRIRVESIETAVTSVRVCLGGFVDLGAKALPSDAANTNLSYTIEDETIAKYENGRVIGLAAGRTVLTIKSEETFSTVSKELAVVISKNGFTGLKEDDSLSPSSLLSYQELNKALKSDTLPSTGNQKVLVVPIEMNDYAFSSDIKTKLDTCFNSTGKDDTKYWESISSYFKKSSNGNLNLSFTIADVYKTSYKAAELKTAAIWLEILNGGLDSYTGDKTVFDSDHNGTLDSVWFVYSAPDYSVNTSLSSIYWAVTTYTGNVGTKAKPALNHFSWASYDFMEEQSSTTIDSHTYVHETGHLLGLDDYYNYSATSAPVGLLEMQSANVGDHNSWDKAALGWETPIIYDYSVVKNAKVHLDPSSTGSSLIVTPKYNNTMFDEGLMIELYTPDGLNKLDSTYAYASTGKLPDTYGIKIYHYDARLVTKAGTETTEQEYLDLDALNDGDTSMLSSASIGAGNTPTYTRNQTKELYPQLTLVSAKKTGGTYLTNRVCYTSDDFFESGDSFTMSEYQASFENKDKLNSGLELNIRINFENVTSTGADIVIQQTTVV